MPKIEKLIDAKLDRRLLNNVPDVDNIRNNIDRRGRKNISTHEGKVKEFVYTQKKGKRYNVNYVVNVFCYRDNKLIRQVKCNASDISKTGILLNTDLKEDAEFIQQSDRIKLKFGIEPGSMPEGNEMKVKISAVVVRALESEDGKYLIGAEFAESLDRYAYRKKERYILFFSGLLLFSISIFIALMRAESIIYFRFNKWNYLYSIIAAVFLLSRYWFGMRYKEEEVDARFTPGVTVIIPCFNEEEWINRTILSCLNQDYPLDKLEVLIVDDCSTDKSVERIKETIDLLKKEAASYDVEDRVKYYVQETNKGKRDALARGCEEAKHDLVVFVDSDSFLDPYAIYHLVQPFKDPKMGGVSGRTDVANTYTNALTKMQSVRYYIAFRIMKAAEAYFDAVTCLSGPLSCYRKDIVLKHEEEWLNQKFLGQRATFGDDRSMTNFVLRNHRTSYQDSAVCYTIVPSEYKSFLKQQMRWKRSWIRESMIAGSFIWRKEPFMSLSFYTGLLVPIAAPIVVIYNLIYVPIVYKVFPTTFVVGVIMMAALMSVMQLFLRKSSTWLFGMLFCFFYESVLLWQMPIAWVTFWKSTWGTRMTPEDVEEQRRKEEKLERRRQKSKRNKQQYDSSGFS